MSKTGLFLLLAIITGFASFQKATASTLSCKYQQLPDTIVSVTDTVYLVSKEMVGTGLLQTPGAPPDSTRKKKIISALFALPFPCGFVGAHRVMLGTNPWIPVVYVATFGGCFGLLPLIDFCFITFSKDITPYENNPHVFMWIK